MAQKNGEKKSSTQNVKAVKEENPKAAKPAAPAFKIESAKKRKRFGNYLFYGDYGVGKTTLAASASEVPEMKNVIFINAEAGDESIKHLDIDIVNISNYSQFARVHEYLRLHCKYRDAWLNDKDKGAYDKLVQYEATLKGAEVEDVGEPTIYHTVVIDSLTEVQKYCMYQLLGIQVGEWALDMAPDSPEWGEWNRSAEMIRLLVRTFRDLPLHTIFVCGQASEQDHQKKYHRQPLLPGKLANEVQGFFDVVGYMVAGPTEGGEMHRRLWITPGETYRAKHRFVGFDGKYIDHPSMADLAKLKLAEKK